MTFRRLTTIFIHFQNTYVIHSSSEGTDRLKLACKYLKFLNFSHTLSEFFALNHRYNKLSVDDHNENKRGQAKTARQIAGPPTEESKAFVAAQSKANLVPSLESATDEQHRASHPCYTMEDVTSIFASATIPGKNIHSPGVPHT